MTAKTLDIPGTHNGLLRGVDETVNSFVSLTTFRNSQSKEKLEQKLQAPFIFSTSFLASHFIPKNKNGLVGFFCI